ncbi:MAG: serine/threonine protein kinase [Polyangiaceae bacterium]|nr:serine/threonine protein kinase [Polyangiaceae bacterium]
MGSVWQAEHVTLHTPVAVKFITPSHEESEDALARFMREAQAAAALRSTHIVQVFDFGVENGTPYMAMELLEGESLATRLQREGRLSPAETARIMSEAARAVEYAHQAGIIHRDLKPDNIFLVREANIEVAKVLDFGIAKVNNDSLSSSSGGSTATGAVLGTPFYLSPEQARGTKAVDHRSDLWALGVIVYECLLGARPFRSTGLGDLVAKICYEPHPVPSEHGTVPQGFDQWVTRALAKEPDDRFQSATEMITAFTMLLSQRIVGTEEEPVPSTAPPQKVLSLVLETTTAGEMTPTVDTPSARRSRSRSRLWSIAGGVLVLSVSVALTWSLAHRRPSAPDRTEAAAAARALVSHPPSTVPAATQQAQTSPAAPAALPPTQKAPAARTKRTNGTSGRARTGPLRSVASGAGRKDALGRSSTAPAPGGAGAPAGSIEARPPRTASGPADDAERAARALFEDRK